MDLFRYIVRFLYKIRWYLIILPLIALVVAWFMTRNMERIYNTSSKLNTEQMTTFLNQLQADAQTELGITLPTPQDRFWEAFYQEYK